MLEDAKWLQGHTQKGISIAEKVVGRSVHANPMPHPLYPINHHCTCRSIVDSIWMMITSYRPVPSFRHRGVLFFCENECYFQLNGCDLHVQYKFMCRSVADPEGFPRFPLKPPLPATDLGATSKLSVKKLTSL